MLFLQNFDFSASTKDAVLVLRFDLGICSFHHLRGEKQKPVHLAFLGLDKAFDRVPRDVVVGTPYDSTPYRESSEWTRILYSCPKSRLQAGAGETNSAGLA